MKPLWITRFALSAGITLSEWDGHVGEWGQVRATRYEKAADFQGSFVLGFDAHATLVEAQEAAEKMRLERVEKLKKQLAKFESMSFKGPGVRVG